MIKKNQIARGVRIKLNDKFPTKCLGDEHLREEAIIFISDEHVYNDVVGEYVHIRGGSLKTSGYAYINEIDLEFPVPEKPIEKAEIIFGEEEIFINHKGEEVVMWNKEEWVEDAHVVFSIVNAVKLAVEDIEKLKKQIKINKEA